MTRPRKPTLVQPGSLQQSFAGTGLPPHQTNAPEASEADRVKQIVDDGMAEVQQHFNAMLQGHPELNPDQREQMARFFGEALEDSRANSGEGDDSALDGDSWRESVDQLRQNGHVDEDEANHLIRSITDALAPLERRESKLAIEFNRRMAREGKDKAIAWLREQSRIDPAAGNADHAPPVPKNENASLGEEVIQSRSRNLRGPPRG